MTESLYCPGCGGPPALTYDRVGGGVGCVMHGGAGTLMTKPEHDAWIKRFATTCESDEPDAT